MMQVDLGGAWGGIGKGAAVARLVQLMQLLGGGAALGNFGGSSIGVIGSPPRGNLGGSPSGPQEEEPRPPGR